MNILLTGSSGYIGTHLKPVLVAAGHQIECCDLKQGQDYRDILGRQFDCVIHLAAFVSVTESMQNPQSYMENNALGVAQFLRENEVKRFILISTGGAMYGDKLLAKEEDVVGLTDLSPYAQSKLMAERFTQVYQSKQQSWVVLRLANVFGGDYSIRGEAAVHAHFSHDNPITVYGGNQTRDFIHIEGVCQAIKRAITLGHGIYNIGSGVETHIGDLAKFYSSTRGVPVETRPKRDGEVQHISLDCSRARQDGLLPAFPCVLTDSSSPCGTQQELLAG